VHLKRRFTPDGLNDVSNIVSTQGVQAMHRHKEGL
jgi:hypothetical protein